MKKHGKQILICIMAVLFLSGLAVPGLAEEDHPEGTTTLLIYMIGSDLESKQGAATEDLQEMLDSGMDTEKVNLLICAGGTSRWQSDLGSTEELSLLHLTGQGFVQEGTMPLMSMGDPDCLAAFVNESVKRYPADHYALIFWDHGNGPVMGYGKDILFDMDALTLAEMRQAMDNTPFADELRLDWVGFDACLMASAELACIWSDYADYLVSSQEVEPGYGWNYAFLSDCGNVSAETLTCAAADSYMAYIEERCAERENYHPEATLSVLDLAAAEELEDAVNDLFRKAADDVSGDYSRLAVARVNTRALGRATTGSEYDLVDLEAAAEQMAEEYPKESAAVLAALEDLVVYNAANTPDCCGVSLYYPYYNKSYYKKYWNETYLDLGVFPDYLTYLTRYEQIWLGTDMQDYFEGKLEVTEGASPSTYTLLLSEEQAAVYAKSNYYILKRETEDVYRIVYCSWDVTEKKGKLTAEFDGQVLYFAGDYEQKGIPFTLMYDTIDGMTDYSAMNVLLTRGDTHGYGDDSLEVEIRFSADRETGELQIKGIFPVEEGDDGFSGGKQEAVDLSEWDMIRFYWMTPRYVSRDENGRMKYFWDWPEKASIMWNELPVADHPTFRFEPLSDDGSEYYILINVMDVQGNCYSSELFPIVLAAAQSEESAPDTEHFVWDSGDTVTLLEKDGITVGMAAVRDLYTGSYIYYLTGSNTNDYPITIHAGGENTLINGTVSGENMYGSLYLSADDSAWQVMPGLTRDLALSGQKTAGTLVFPYKVSRQDNNGILFAGNMEVEISEDLPISIGWDNVLSARAEEQLLLNTDGIRVTLQGFGIIKDENYTGREKDKTNPKTLYYIENESGADASIEISGITVNGIYMHIGNAVTLKDGTAWLGYDYLDTETIMALGDPFRFDEPGEGSLPWITSVSDLSVVLKINGTAYSCPVILAEKGIQEVFAIEDDPVYQDDTLEIYLYSVEEGEDYFGDETICWNFWICNRTERQLSMFLFPPGSYDFFDRYDYYDIGPHSAVLGSLSLPAENGRELTVEFIDFEEGSSYSSAPVMLHAE